MRLSLPPLIAGLPVGQLVGEVAAAGADIEALAARLEAA